MSKLNHFEKQKFIDYIFINADCDYYQDLLFIQKTLNNNFNIYLGISECLQFWSWRSDQYDANFLGIKDKQEICEWFHKYVDNFYEDFDDEEIKEILARMNKN